MQDSSKEIVLCAMLSITSFCSLLFADEQTDEEILVQDNFAFAIDLYQRLRALDGNLIFSPYSISTALAMTYAGARDNTEKEMAETLWFSLGQETLHPAFSSLESGLNKLQKAGNVRLSVANSLWPQQDYEFLNEYLSLIKKHYGVSVTPVDFKRAGEAARKMINTWAEDQTQQKIKDLIQPGALDALTRLVLVNAIYFKGNWKIQLETGRTKDAPFYISPDNSVQVPMMAQKQTFGYAEYETLQVLELPYVGGELSMIVLLPRKINGLEQLESTLTAENLKQWTRRLVKREVLVFIPKFNVTSMFRLDKTLAAMGMVDAFRKGTANFAGMDGRPDWLYVGAMLHKAFVEVNEKGTEAAAATAVVMKGKSTPARPPTFRADHPFIFLTRESRTGSILFIGRVSDPTKSGE